MITVVAITAYAGLPTHQTGLQESRHSRPSKPVANRFLPRAGFHRARYDGRAGRVSDHQRAPGPFDRARHREPEIPTPTGTDATDGSWNTSGAPATPCRSPAPWMARRSSDLVHDVMRDICDAEEIRNSTSSLRELGCHSAARAGRSARFSVTVLPEGHPPRRIRRGYSAAR